jgi:hypothetical protein
MDTRGNHFDRDSNVKIYRESESDERELLRSALLTQLMHAGELVGVVASFAQILRKASRAGILRSTLDKLLEEGEQLGLSRAQVESNPHVVEYPWMAFPRFVVLPEPAVYNRILYSRNACIISETTQRAMAGLRVGIAGLSVGGVAGVLLIRAGCTSITGVDGGMLDGKDLNRSGFGRASTIATPQAVAFERACLEINPYCDVEARPEFLGETGLRAADFVCRTDIVIDAVDSPQAKWDLRVAAKAAKKTVVMASDLGSASCYR